jgi:hypothetical protein
MIEKRTGLGILATITWLGVASALLYAKRASLCTLDVNEWGDFFAGAFAPVAFLWLVLGYMQQGDELRSNREELAKQVKALRDANEAQLGLLKLESDRLTEERALREFEVLPNLHLQGTGSRAADLGHVEYEFTLSNLGGTAVSLECNLLLDGQRPQLLLSPPLVTKGEQRSASLRLPPRLAAANARLRITYSDALTRAHEVFFSIGRESEQPGLPALFYKVETS